MSTVASCIVKSATTLQWTVNPSYVAAHKGKSSAPEAQYGLKRAYSAHVMSATNMLVQECSRICLNGFLEKKILCLRDQCPSNFNTLGWGHSFSAQG